MFTLEFVEIAKRINHGKADYKKPIVQHKYAMEKGVGRGVQLVRFFSYRYLKTYKTYHAQPWNSGNQFMKASQDLALK